MTRKSHLLLDELLEYAPQLAKEQNQIGTSRRVVLPRQLKKNLQKLNSIYYKTLEKFEKEIELSTTGKWLIDNRYLLNEQYHYIQKNFRRDLFRRLPVLVSGRMKGSLRIYAILDHLLKQSDGRSNPEILTSFLWAYQRTQPLTIRELWAVPLVLRFVIFHQMRVLYEETNRFRLSKTQERIWKKRVVPLLQSPSPDLNKAISRMEQHLDLSDPAVLLFLGKQFRRAARFKPLSRWLEARAIAQNLPLPKLLEEEENAQTQNGIVVGNLFTGLQQINRANWTEYFEELSLVEQILRQDPARVYPEMDFESRDLIRCELELLARETRTPEEDVAKKVLTLAQASKGTGEDPLKRHVGYYLLDQGLTQLTKVISGRRRGFLRKIRHLLQAKPNFTYFSSLTLIFTLFFTVFLYATNSLFSFDPLYLLICGLLLVVPTGEIAVRLLHSLLSRIIPPRRLPRIEFKNGIPLEYSTMVVIPTLLTSVTDLQKLLKQLEVYHLANRDPHIYFALLTDFPDAPGQEEPGDSLLLEEALAGIAALNKRYPHPEQNDYFYLLHRERRYNPNEGVWMGWERKRGKLTEFNALLAGEENTSFTVISGHRELFKTIKYVITLDSDTQLPKEAAARLIGAIAHPLNAPVIEEEKGIVTKGYGILQPKITVNSTSANRTLYSLLNSDATGIDIYSCAASNPYQDLFGRGIFTGKGIYDARVFDQLLRRRIPENSVLSHDLLEGSFLRAGLVTDIELQDDFPSSLLSNLARKHRWTRGDWQLLPWLKRTVLNQDKEKIPLRLPAITRWQMIDNLRQSLLTPALLLLAWMGLLFLPGKNIRLQPLHWAVIGFLCLSCVMEFFKTVKFGTSFLHCLGRQLFNLVTMPYQAITMLDAIFRSLYRMTISHRYLLEWMTAAEAMKQAADSLWGTWRQMWKGQLVTVVGFILISRINPAALPWIGLLSLLWLSAPILVYFSSVPLLPKKPKLTSEEQLYLRRLAWRIWHFFETIVTPQDHWLPPDNLQIQPENGLAHRTSPTNIGLYLTSIISARDFGYITTAQMIQRIDCTVGTLEELEKWYGHLYNWYDTESLKPLHPLYISTVDSGNLVVYFLVVQQALKEWLHKSWTKALAQGLLDTFQSTLDSKKAENNFSAYFTPYLNRSLSLWEWYSLLKTVWHRESPSIQCKRVISRQLQEMEWFFPWLPMLEVTNPTPANEGLFSIENLSQISAYLSPMPNRGEDSCPEQGVSTELVESLTLSKQRCTELLEKGEALINRLERLVTAHDFTVLYDRSQRLFSIGYNISDGQLDPTFYNLLASEARQASFVAIALGQVPVKHWFALSRTSTLIQRRPVLLSWTGTIFEYLMPLLVMTSRPNTLWEKTYRLVLKSQIAYGKRTNLPWGISESGYYLFDQHLNYQYKAFGVPDLALKHSQEREKVVAPYATILGAMIDPKASIANLNRLEGYGAVGEYGFYEAIDFTPHRLQEGQDYAVVKSYMAHHQGMSLIALGNLFHDFQMQRRFLADPRIKGTDLLLHEQIHNPTLIKSKKVPGRLVEKPYYLYEEPVEPRSFITPETPSPRTWFLSNGRYFVMVSNSGGGFSRSRDLLLTRWEEDPVKDNYGSFFYIKNLTKDEVWSPSFQPCRDSSALFAMSSDLGKVVFTRTAEDFTTQLEICVPPEIDAELRRISLTNRGAYPCTIEVTSVLEPVLATKKAYQAHPAFSRLFLETEAVIEKEALLARRRNGVSTSSPWLVHSVHVHGQPIGPLEYETDRSRFVGRGQSYRVPTVIETNQRLSGTTGTVLDSILSLRRCVQVEPGTTVQLTFITGLASTREKALAITDNFSSAAQIQQAFDLAQIESHLELRRFNLTTQQVRIFQFIASQLFYLNYYRKSRSEYLQKNVKDQSSLWPYGISGDLPIVLVHLKEDDSLELAAQILQAYNFWKMKGLASDLIFLSTQKGSYQQNLHDSLRRLVETITGPRNQEQPGGVFILSKASICEADLILLETVARVSLRSDEGSLLSQLQLSLEPRRKTLVSRPVCLPVPNLSNFVPTEPPEELEFFNGWGGFTPSGTEYVIHLRTRDLLPAPWINVIANPQFGFTISQSGGGFTWAKNSREYKLTPWSNDPVLDPSGEICYLRDEKTGLLWSVNALPIRDNEPYTIRHGQGYTRFHHESNGIDQTALVFTPTNAPLKIYSLKLRNTQGYARELAVTYYLEWTLGVNREETSPFLITEYDRSSGALIARNTYQRAFFGYYAFLGMSTDGPEISRSWTCDRAEFIGRNGSLSLPAGMTRDTLSNTTGALFHPCAAMQVKFDLPPHEERTVNIIIGSTSSLEEARNYMRQYGRKAKVKSAYQDVVQFWSTLLERVQVSTPDRGFDLLMNRWLLYQTVSCRLWARSAFYQSGGAYGFRDQLQDTLALLHASPGLTRKQILLHAAHQYKEGDVQHWWHEETGYGIRTRISDDLLWLVYAACRYVNHTGNRRIWDQEIPFLESPPLEEGEMERYEPTVISGETGTLYEHCIRAIERSLRFGAHGLPLMGGGDWNDGMNLVGAGGDGESVWLGWFLYHVLEEFIPFVLERGENERVDKYKAISEKLAASLNEQCWDGQWFRRAYNDLGEPLGAMSNLECQIDCIAQVWGVISGAADPDKALLAMESLDDHLVHRDNSLVCLLTPPFDQSEPSPGYIQAYPIGVRENGGQYTHGAVWAIIAWALLGNGNKAYELFQILNPINHTRTPGETRQYKVEPYVMAADVYSVPPYTGRGGWSWYTGAAGWMYQAGLEWILGIRKKGDRLHLQPCIPADWPGYSVVYQYGRSTYHLRIENPNHKETGGRLLTIDGKEEPQIDLGIPLVNDGQTHQVLLVL